MIILTKDLAVKFPAVHIFIFMSSSFFHWLLWQRVCPHTNPLSVSSCLHLVLLYCVCCSPNLKVLALTEEHNFSKPTSRILPDLHFFFSGRNGRWVLFRRKNVPPGTSSSFLCMTPCASLKWFCPICIFSASPQTLRRSSWFYVIKNKCFCVQCLMWQNAWK